MIGRIVRAVTTTSLGRRLRAAARDLEWTIRGRGIRNPPLPAHVDSLLFICKGNICRSPFAAQIARRILEGAGRTGIRCDSAGLRTTQSDRSPVDACAAALRFNISLTDHTPVQLTQEAADAYALIVVMEHGQVEGVARAFPGAARKTQLLPLAAGGRRSGYSRYHISDPFGQPRAAFDDCYERLECDVRALLDELGLTRGASASRNA